MVDWFASTSNNLCFLCGDATSENALKMTSKFIMYLLVLYYVNSKCELVLHLMLSSEGQL